MVLRAATDSIWRLNMTPRAAMVYKFIVSFEKLCLKHLVYLDDLFEYSVGLSSQTTRTDIQIRDSKQTFRTVIPNRHSEQTFQTDLPNIFNPNRHSKPDIPSGHSERTFRIDNQTNKPNTYLTQIKNPQLALYKVKRLFFKREWHKTKVIPRPCSPGTK